MKERKKKERKERESKRERHRETERERMLKHKNIVTPLSEEGEERVS